MTTNNGFGRRLLLVGVASTIFLLSTLSLHSNAANPQFRKPLLAAADPHRRRQLPDCSDVATRSECLRNPKCRWCRSDALDDACFSKSEAWRLPSQVFLCD